MHQARLVRRIHSTSAIILIVFVAFHLANHLAALHGIEAHRTVMATARVVYRSFIGEAVLLAAVAAQVLTGALQLRAKSGLGRGFWPGLQRLSGAYLIFFLTAHTLAMLMIRTVFGLDTNFYAGASVVLVWPLSLGFVPYYTLAVVAVIAHVACGLKRAPAFLPFVPESTAKALLVLAPLVAVTIVATAAGAFYPIDLPQPYRDMCEVYLRLLGWH